MVNLSLENRLDRLVNPDSRSVNSVKAKRIIAVLGIQFSLSQVSSQAFEQMQGLLHADQALRWRNHLEILVSA
jgi:hypothetical protein